MGIGQLGAFPLSPMEFSSKFGMVFLRDGTELYSYEIAVTKLSDTYGWTIKR